MDLSNGNKGNIMAAKFRIHLKQLVLNKAAKTGESILQKDIQEQTGLSLPTIGRWMSGDVDRIEAETISRLTKYLGCKMSDLVELDDTED
jgi:DNA-binding Xre family transcriptional regulator